MKKEIEEIRTNILEARFAIEEVLFSKNRSNDAKNIIRAAREIREAFERINELENE